MITNIIEMPTQGFVFTHIAIHLLQPGELPIYDISDGLRGGEYHILRFDGGRPYWEPVRVGGLRIILPLEIDLEVPRLDVGISLPRQIHAWFQAAQSIPASDYNTLILAIRSMGPTPDGRTHYVVAGMGSVPDVMGSQAPARDALVDIVFEVLRTPSQHWPPHIRLRLADLTREFRAEQDISRFLHNSKSQDYNQRARLLLYNCLSLEQIAELEEEGYFTVRGADDHTYRIYDESHHNLHRIDGKSIIQYCVVARKPVPNHDLMLAQKLYLETDPQALLSVANQWQLDRGRAIEIDHWRRNNHRRRHWEDYPLEETG